ncbi:carbohydrate sulfotransferase 7-like [Polyodon spathula]|uniref:carbohydrate sulfotransferase 7-like n=1 Tax=Polyodon spathula TaxID=7913 RepID=UPI001B7E2F8D|nr:carbohydrate sulfotransferase 7-like [Polyodon spathula]
MKRLQKKYLILIIGYSVVLLLIPYVLDYSKTDPRFQPGLQKQRCPDLENSMGLWNIEEKASNETGMSEENGNGGKTKTFIYLHATWRTGSSFLGELFNQHPDVFYLYEPMWHMWQTLYPGDAESLQGALRDMLGSLFRCDFSVLKLYTATQNLTTSSIFGWKKNKVICSEPLCPAYKKDEIGLINESACQKCPARDIKSLERECRKYPVVVIKDVRVLDLGVLVPLMQDPSLNLQVIQLFRDPRAVHNSRLKSKQALVRESIQVLRSKQRSDKHKRMLVPNRSQRADSYVSSAMEVICESWLKDLLLIRSAPRWVTRNYLSLRYEDLVLHPVKQLQSLFRFSNLTLLPAIENFVLNMTRGDNYPSDKPFLISSRDAKEAIHAWRERLSLEQVRQVEAYCSEVLSLLVYH